MDRANKGRNKTKTGVKNTMTQQYYEYITKEGDRWDLIAWQFYTNASLYEPIIKANADVAIEPILKSGIKLKIPVLDTENTIQFQLPPWRK